MKKLIILFISFLLLTSLYNCTEKEAIPVDSEIQNFVWKAMNLYYLWQEEIPDLQDNRFSNQTDLNSFLENRSPENVFDALLFESDRFSWIVDDYIALENQFAGETDNNGMEYGLVAIAENENQIFGYVRYVIPNSDAEEKGIRRGQIIYGINGNQLSRSNFRDLFANAIYTVDFGTYSVVDGMAQIISNNEHIELTKEILTENPVHTITVNEINGRKIGYVLYNQFTNEFDTDLNDAFTQLKNENITDLVLDLRYNGGGSVNTAVALSSMITGQFDNELFTTLNYNEKLNDLIGIQSINFQNQLTTGETISKLNLNEVYVLISGSTASASELVINSLKPYINVILIGNKTVGKAVGSVTLYDSPNYRKTDANPNHTYALQPIVSELVNKLGENNKEGFTPNFELFEDYENLGVLGDINEQLFSKAITEITGFRFTTIFNNLDLNLLGDSKGENSQNNMFHKTNP